MGAFVNIHSVGKYLRIAGADYEKTAIGKGPLPGDDGRMWAVYEINDISSPSTLLYTAQGISAMTVDGVFVPVSTTHQFSEVGKHLVKYTIGDTIAANQFATCGLLSELYLPKKVVNYGSRSLMNCSGLKTLQLSKVALNYAQGFITGASQLTHYVLPAGVKKVSFRTMTSLDLQNDDLPDGLIAADFLDCTSMTHLTRLPDSVESLGSCQNCVFPLERLPANLSGSIPANCFARCNNATFKEIPAGVTSIGAAAFFNVLPEYMHILNTNAIVTLANKSAFSGSYPIYVGDGQSAAADDALLSQYTADSVWGQLSARLKTWYSYLNP